MNNETIRTGDQPAYPVNAREGSAAGEVGNAAHWRCMLACNDGQHAHGAGMTKEEAEQNTRNARAEIEKIAASSPVSRIKAFLAKYPAGDYPRAYDMGLWLRAVSEAIVEISQQGETVSEDSGAGHEPGGVVYNAIHGIED